jgi:hypothetical protein
VRKVALDVSTPAVNMATVRNKREVLGVKGKVKNDTTNIRLGGGGATDVCCREFGFINFTVQTIWKNSAFEHNVSRIKLRNAHFWVNTQRILVKLFQKPCTK